MCEDTVDIATDAENCGECGRSCESGTCEDRGCVGTTVYSTQAELCTGFTVDEEYIYFVEDSEIHRVWADGSGLLQVIYMADEVDQRLSDLKVIDGRLFFVNGSEGLYSCALDGTDLVLHFYDEAVRAYALEPGASEIYITAENGEEVHRIPREHGGVTPSPTASEPLFEGYSQVMSMDSNDTHVAWTDGAGSTLYILDKGTDELTAIPRAEPFDFPSDAHFVGDALYFLDGSDSVNGDQAMMMAVDGQPEPIGREGTYYGIASDGDTIYTVGHGGVYQPGREVYEREDPEELDIILEVEEVDFLLGATGASWLATASDGYMYYLSTVAGEDCRVDRVRL